MADPFATADDVAGRWRPLTAAEIVVAGNLCSDASVMIRSQYPGIDDRVTSGALDPLAPMIAVVTMVKSAMVAGADGVTQQSETTGPFSRSQSYANPTGNLFITAAIDKLLRGYQPAGMSTGFANTTTNLEGVGPAYVYGYGW